MCPSSQPTDIVSDVTATPEPAELDPFEDLLDVLDLKTVGAAHISVDSPGDDESDLGDSEADIFVGRSQPMPHGRVFGGQVLAQSIIAAGRTVQDRDGEPRHIHSLHGYFLRPGDSSHPIRFAVERLRDGRSFSARRVHAIQYGKPILSMITSFQTQAGGLDHQDSMPASPDPEQLPTTAEELADVDEAVSGFWSRRQSIDLRHVEGAVYVTPGRQRAAQQSVWLKAAGRLPDDPLLHAAVLAYSSDYSLLEAVLRKHGLAWADPRLRPASLDHAMWFHRPARADEWTLYTQASPSASGGRGLATGRMFAADGTLVASVAQEGMLRVKES
jgi:acyl-CoA thioesterase-2